MTYELPPADMPDAQGLAPVSPQTPPVIEGTIDPSSIPDSGNYVSSDQFTVLLQIRNKDCKNRAFV